jgi:hypothetical protein
MFVHPAVMEMAVSDGKPYHFQLVVGEAVVVPTTTGFHTKSNHSYQSIASFPVSSLLSTFTSATCGASSLVV